jgi:hypothetical protein
VCGRLAVGDDDDLLVATGRRVKQLAGDDERVLQIRAVLELVGRQRRDGLRLELPGVVREADHEQPIARVLGVDERVERHRHLLGRR